MRTTLGILAFAVAALGTAAQTIYTPSGTVGTSATGNVGIGRPDPVARLDVQGTSADANAWALWLRNSNGNVIVGARNDGHFVLGNGLTDQVVKDASGKVGIGTVSPSYLLHVSGDVGVNGDQKFFARYNGSENYKASFGWSHLQLGNNGPNWIVAGRTAAGGAMTFVVNNTSDYAYNAFNGIQAMHISAAGNVGIGTLSPGAKLDVVGLMAKVRTANGGWYIYSGEDAFRAALYDDGVTTKLYGDGNGTTPVLTIDAGNVGIGTTNPIHKLAVNGTIRAKEVIVDTGWADHVFAADYRLVPLSEVEQHIQQKGHLPDVPSAADVAARGVSVGEMQKILLQKIEELTLHQIAHDKRLAEVEAENITLRAQVSALTRPQ